MPYKLHDLSSSSKYFKLRYRTVDSFSSKIKDCPLPLIKKSIRLSFYIKERVFFVLNSDG